MPLLWMLGCTQSFRLEGRHARQVVADYAAKERIDLAAGGKHYTITPSQQPRLRVHSDTCLVSGYGRAAEADCGDLEGRLRDAHVLGEQLHLRPYAPLRLDSIDEVLLIVEGERARAREEATAADGRAPSSQGADRKQRRRPTQFWGAQLGGSGYAQLSFRWAFVKYVHVELGAFAIGPELVANASAGLVAELPFQGGWAPYVGGGVGAGLAAGPGEQEECGKPSAECPSLHSHESTEFWYGRVGLAKYTAALDQRVGVDVGFWRGVWREGAPERSESFLWPMAGISYHLGF